MVSFGKRKTKALRFGVPLLLFAVGVVLPLFTNPAPASAASYPTPNNPGTNNIVVTIQNGKFDEPAFRGYTVTATRIEPLGSGDNLNFSYQPNGALGDGSLGDYLSDSFTWAGDPYACTSATDARIANKNRFSIVVKKDNKQVGTGTLDGCGKPYLNTFSQVIVTVNENAAAPGSLSGTIKYTSFYDQSSQHFMASAKLTMVCSDGQTRNVPVDDNGHYSVTNLPPGECTLNGNYISPAPDSRGYFVKDAKKTIVSGKDTNGDIDATVGADTPTDPDTDDGDSKFIDCGSGGFNFFICPALKLAIAAGSKVDSFIMQQLEVDATKIFDNTRVPSSTSAGYYQAWSQFRIIATSLLIIGGLVMVVSTALGFEFLDAYTIRKTLPRLLIAIIGISLSWPLMKLCVTFFDTLGFDIRAIMYAPFKGMTGQVSVGTGLLSSFTVGVGLFAFGPTALTFIITACLALFVGFLILIIRQAAIIMLVILAPVAIACFVLPNTQKVWKLWYDNFLGLLLMFPIISALIAAGHIFAAVTVNSNQGDSPQAVIAQAIAIIAYFIPYFLLPMAARLATGIIGNIAGFVNDRHKGAFDRLKVARDNALKNRHQMRMNQQMMTGKAGNLYRRLGSVGVPNSGALSLTNQGRAKYAAYQQQLHQQRSAEALKNDNGRAAGDDDATALAVQRGMDRSKFLQEYQKMGHTQQEAQIALAVTERGFNAKMGSDSMAVAAFKARAGSSTAYSGDEAGTAQRINEGRELIRAGLMNAADATAAGKGNRARLDISGNSFSAQMAAFSGAGQMTHEQAQQYLDATLQAAEPGDLLAGNGRTVHAMAPAMVRNLNKALQGRATATANGDTAGAADFNRQINRALGQIAGVQDNLNRTSPEKAAMFADFVNSAQVKLGDASQGQSEFITVRQAVANAAVAPADNHGNQEFLAVRKEYGSAATKGPLQNQPDPNPET